MAEHSGAQALVQTLSLCGVRAIFGVPGTQSVALFDALSRQEAIRTMLATDEGAAGFMAHGYYRASGRLAAVTTIPGPGLTNTLTAVAESREDSVALLHVMVTSSGEDSRPHELQPAYLEAMSPDFYKDAMTISSRSEVERMTALACQRALSGEPGPVLLTLSPQVLHTMGTATVAQGAPPVMSRPELEALLTQLVQRLATSGRICVLVGQGACEAGTALKSLIDLTGALAIANASGRGALSDDHPRTVCGDFGGWGVDLVNQVIQQSDVVLAVGCKFTHNGSGGFRLTLPESKHIRLDVSPDVPAAHYPASLHVVADARRVLERVVDLLREHQRGGLSWTEPEREAWRTKFDAARADSVRHQSDLIDWPRHRIDDFFRALRAVMPRDSHVVTDSGQHQLWARQHYAVWAPRGLIVPTDFQSMGFALPAAMGAKLARASVPVVAIVGDGGFMMSGMSLATAVRERIPLTVIVFNDGALSQIQYQQWQEFGRDFATTPGSISFAAFAAALGMDYALLGPDPEQTLRRSLSSGNVTLLELRLQGSASVAAAALVAKTKSMLRMGPGYALLKSLWRRVSPPR